MTSLEALRAIRKCDLEELRRLQTTGYSVLERTESEHWTLLHRAYMSIRSHPCREMINLLLAEGVDVKAVDFYGNTALHYAAASGDAIGVETLLSAGANPNSENRDRSTPLRTAVCSNSPGAFNCISVLLVGGADPEHRYEGACTVRELVERIRWPTDEIPMLFRKLKSPRIE